MDYDGWRLAYPPHWDNDPDDDDDDDADLDSDIGEDRADDDFACS